MSDFYFEISVTPSHFSEIFASEIISITQEALEQVANTLIVRTSRDESFVDSLIDELQKLSKKLSRINCIEVDFKYTIAKKENKDWISEYKKSITSICCSRFYIRPPWAESIHTFDKQDDKIEIILEPSLAFGSGHHSSTFMCIEALTECNYRKNTLMLDVGCGSGILAICGAKLGASVYLCDIDELAILESKKNFAKNNVAIQGIWQGSINDVNNKHKYDIVTANIVASVLIEQSINLINVLHKNGILILSGILYQYENDVLNAFRGLKLIDKKYNDEWVCLKLQKYGE